ncbi:MAG: transposase [Nitrososphaera sp.]
MWFVSEKARSAEFISFLEYVREQNPVGKLWIVLDNARIHHARTVTERAAELEIEFVHLPPYSPDLNPIEFGCKDLKKELGSMLDFDQMVENVQEVAVQLFWHRKKSYSGYWDRRFTDGYLFGSKVG